MSEQKTCFIYCLKDPDGDCIRYVGKTNNKRIRFNNHRSDSSRRRTHKEKWIYSLISQGKSPVMQILKEVTSEQWQWWERWFIKNLTKRGHKLTNATRGGIGFKSSHSTATRHKISTTLKTVGKARFTDEARRRIAESKKGKKNGMYGRKASDLAKKVTSDRLKGVKKSPEQIEKMRKGSPIMKRVLQIDPVSGGIIKEYSSIHEAGRAIGINFKNISTVCNGRRNLAGGYKWVFSN